MTELERTRKYEKLGYHHLAAADRALRQLTLPNAPKLKFFDAVDLWHKSGKCFAIAGEWEESAHSFALAADFMVKLNKPHEAAVFWLKSAEMLRRVDPVGSMVPYGTAADLYTKLDRFATAANITRNLAEMLEDFKEWNKAVNTYEKAAEYYDSEHYNTQSCVCLYRAGYILALLEKFDRAVALFERVATTWREDNMLRMNIPWLFLRAGLCYIAQGGAIRKGLYSHQVLRYKMKQWSTIDYSFEYSRERLFLDNLIDIIPTADINLFADHVFNFDNVAQLDSMMIKMLARAKFDIEEENYFRDEAQRKHEQELADIRAKEADELKDSYHTG